ncbi:outer membrane protein assembly factor BamB family protein [Algoriphagus chordae]|uniref:Outer membrane protein assembly factor BamB n=1 Tax=Algoriphagus chordae TaxID=237019 RepID=A0A2W7RQL6_9BACT|nr:PQQ-binding-like beta-propeller repeat protein [Algoriphagus chordae]PZX56769.1 outer membrane protein assembly factor BamB [Algoriphagus chordae]
MKIKLSFALIFMIGMSQSVFAQLKGTIYWDENGNGVKDASEKGVSEAVVSDGLHVIRTNADGTFDLEGWEKQRFVTIYPSADFDSPTRYIPITSNSQNYDFGVIAKEKKENVTFLHISDTETYEYGDWVDDLKKYIKVQKPDFVVHTGDICYESGMKWHSEHLTEKQLGIPIYYNLGNHDLIKGEYGEKYFESKFGPAWYALEVGNTLYVITPMMSGDYAPSFTREDIGTWMQNLVNAYAKDMPKIFFNHDLLTNGDEFDFKVNEEKSIHLNDYNLKSWVYGHWHINMVKTHGESGVTTYSTATLAMGGIDHSPSSFREIKVDAKGDTKSQLIWTYLDRDIQIVNPQEGNMTLSSDGLLHFSVNVYDSGSEVDSVLYSLWDKNGFSWTSSMQEDNWSKMNKVTDWNWRANIDPGDHTNATLVVDAYLASGEIIHRKSTFRIVTAASPEVTTNDTWANLAGNSAHDAVVSSVQKPPYELAWTANIGSNIYMSSPVLFKQFVLSAGFDDSNEDKNFIACWDAFGGEEVWKFRTKNGVKNQMVIVGDLVVATDMLGITYAIDIASGELIWEKDLQYRRLPGFITGLVTDGEIVYTGFAEALSALDAASGNIIWTSKKGGGGEGTTPTMTIADSVLITGRHWGSLDAFDRFTGKFLWSRSDQGLRFRDGVIAYKEGSLWVAEQDTFHEIDLKTGETKRTFATAMKNTGTSSPIVLKDRVILAGSNPGLASFDRTTGQKLWEFEVDPALFYTPSYFKDQQQSLESTPILVGDHLVFGAMDGKVYAVEANTGRLLWKRYLGAPIMTSAAISDKGFYICDFAGNIYYYESLNGTPY